MNPLNLCLPEPLQVIGSKVADDWSLFKEQYGNHELAPNINEASQEKHAAVFLTCISDNAYDIYRDINSRTTTTVKSLIQLLRRSRNSVLEL